MEIVGQNTVYAHLKNFFCLLGSICLTKVASDTVRVALIYHRLIVRIPGDKLNLI